MAYNREDILKEMQRRGINPESIAQPQQQVENPNGGYSRQAIEAEMARRVAKNEQPQQQQEEQNNPETIGLRVLGNLASGGAQAGRALRNAPYNLTKAATNAINFFSPGAVPDVADYIANNTGWAGKHFFAPENSEMSSFGINNPKLLDRLIQGAAGAGPIAALTGGTSLGGMMTGGAISGGILNEENPLLGAALGAGTGTIAKAVPSLISIFKNMKPQKIANKFDTKYNTKGLEKIEAPNKANWEKALASEEDIYTKINPNTRLTTPAQAKYVNKIGDESEYAHLRDLFAQNPNLKNTHNLQSAIGEEIGGLLKKKAIEITLPPADMVRLHELKGIRNDLKLDINNYLEKVSPELKELYNNAAKIHRDVVIPARNAARLQGKIPRNTNGTINKEKLASSLENAETPEKIGTIEKRGYKPLPEDVLTLRKQLEQNMKNKKKVFNPYTIGSATIATTGLGYHKAHLLRHLLGY